MPTRQVQVPGTGYRKRYNAAGQLTHSDSFVHQAHFYWTENKPLTSRRRKPEGWLKPTPYYLEVSTVRGGYGSYSTAIAGDQIDRWSGALAGTLTNYPEMAPFYVNGSIARAEIKALIAVKGQRVNLGVAFAEAQKTANLIGSTATRLAKAYSAFRKGRIKQALGFLGIGRVKQLPKTWLEMQYGWLPLLSEVHGSIQELIASEPHKWRVTGKGIVRESKDDDVTVNGSGCWFRALGKRQFGVYVRLDYEPDAKYLTSLSRLGLTNPAEVLWEIVPFSFVVDWFVPIGDWLGTMDATLGLKFLSGSGTVYQSVKHQLSSAPAQGSYLGGSFSGSRRHVIVNRYVYASSPFPMPPGLNKNPLSLKRMTNGLALLAQAVK